MPTSATPSAHSMNIRPLGRLGDCTFRLNEEPLTVVSPRMSALSSVRMLFTTVAVHCDRAVGSSLVMTKLGMKPPFLTRRLTRSDWDTDSFSWRGAAGGGGAGAGGGAASGSGASATG